MAPAKKTAPKASTTSTLTTWDKVKAGAITAADFYFRACEALLAGAWLVSKAIFNIAATLGVIALAIFVVALIIAVTVATGVAFTLLGAVFATALGWLIGYAVTYVFPVTVATFLAWIGLPFGLETLVAGSSFAVWFVRRAFGLAPNHGVAANLKSQLDKVSKLLDTRIALLKAAIK